MEGIVPPPQQLHFPRRGLMISPANIEPANIEPATVAYATFAYATFEYATVAYARIEPVILRAQIISGAIFVYTIISTAQMCTMKIVQNCVELCKFCIVPKSLSMI